MISLSFFLEYSTVNMNYLSCRVAAWSYESFDKISLRIKARFKMLDFFTGYYYYPANTASYEWYENELLRILKTVSEENKPPIHRCLLIQEQNLYKKEYTTLHRYTACQSKKTTVIRITDRQYIRWLLEWVRYY